VTDARDPLTEAPEPVVPDGWEPASVPEGFGRGRSFVSGDTDPARLRVRYYRKGKADGLLVKAWFGLHAEGPPGHVHGGAIAAVLDEAMGTVAWGSGVASLAGGLKVRYRAATPLGVDYTVRAWLDRKDGKKVHVRSELRSPGEETVFAEGDGLFIAIDPARIASLVDREADHATSPFRRKAESLRKKPDE